MGIGLSASTVVLFAIIAIIVAVLAIYLIAIAAILRGVSFNLGTVLIGVKAICHQVEPVPKYVAIILNDVLAIDQAAKQLLAWGGGSEEGDKVSHMAALRP
jgi:hypothetical protein